MATTIKIGEAVTVGTAAVEYEIDESFASLPKPFVDLPISTASGNSSTIQFSVGETPAAGQSAVAADTKTLILGVQNGFRNLWAKGGAAGQVFKIG
jgi:hypothetical protein